jgi:hypothetical protein
MIDDGDDVKAAKRAVISSLVGAVICGGLPERLNFTGVLIGRVENYLYEQLDEKNNAKFLHRVITAIDGAVDGMYQLAFGEKAGATYAERKKMVELISRGVFVVNEKWDIKQAAEDMELIHDITRIQTARRNFESACAADAAITPYTYGVNNPIVMECLDSAIRTVTNVCDRWGLIGYDNSSDWGKKIDQTVKTLHEAVPEVKK